MSPALYNESGVGLGTVKNKLGKDDSRRSIDQYKEKKGLVTTKGKELIYTVFFNRSTNSSSFTNDYYYDVQLPINHVISKTVLHLVAVCITSQKHSKHMLKVCRKFSKKI